MNETLQQRLGLFTVLLLTVFVTSGVSFALFNYFGQGTTSNYIKTGGILFSYNESTVLGNGIKLESAMPMSDTEGKSLTGSDKVFDFQVTSTVKSYDPVQYKIVAKKEQTSNFADNLVKIYLTKLSGSNEKELEECINGKLKVKTFNNYTNMNPNEETQKVLYNESIEAGTDYIENFRLRMWVSEDTTMNDAHLMDKTFSIKIDVYAQS